MEDFTAHDFETLEKKVDAIAKSQAASLSKQENLDWIVTQLQATVDTMEKRIWGNGGGAPGLVATIEILTQKVDALTKINFSEMTGAAIKTALDSERRYLDLLIETKITKEAEDKVEKYDKRPGGFTDVMRSIAIPVLTTIIITFVLKLLIP